MVPGLREIIRRLSSKLVAQLVYKVFEEARGLAGFCRCLSRTQRIVRITAVCVVFDGPVDSTYATMKARRPEKLPGTSQ
jgi:hypothetical protein